MQRSFSCCQTLNRNFQIKLKPQKYFSAFYNLHYFKFIFLHYLICFNLVKHYQYSLFLQKKIKINFKILFITSSLLIQKELDEFRLYALFQLWLCLHCLQYIFCTKCNTFKDFHFINKTQLMIISNFFKQSHFVIKCFERFLDQYNVSC